MSIRRFVLTLPALVLVLLLLVGFFPGGAAFAEGGGDPLALRFVCDETVASVTVYDLAGLPLPVGADGIHHLTPGTYFYSATAEGYESTGLQAFTIPADAAGDQELRISLTPVPGSVPPDAAAPGETPSDVSVPSQTPVNAPDPNAPEENPEDDGKLRIRPVDGSLTLTVERETKTESAVPPEVQNLLEGKQKPLQTADGKPVEKKLWLKTPDAEELYLDRLAVEKEIGYYTTDWTVLNLTDEEGDRKNLLPASGWYDVTVSGPATETYRAYEPVFALVTLHWDEDGVIIDRDVTILETTHTPTKSSWSFSTDTLSTLVIAVPTDRPVESEEAAAKKDRPAFAASSTVDGVTVTVSAPAGVFPADAALWVQRVPLTEEIDAAVESERDEQKTVAVSYTFDIRVVNPETMEEYQPEEGQSVSVSFALAEVADENLETRVYHVTEEESTGALTAEALEVSEEGLTATTETEGFSYYQVEFTYEKLEYVLPGDTSVPLAEILAELGLSGDVTEVSCSNTNLFSCDWTENRWVVTAHRAFSSTEWMKVTLNNVVYEITVTDEQDGVWEFEWISDSSLMITKYNGTGGDVVIPDKLKYYGSEIPVTGIGYGAFDGCDSLTSITIPASVTTIGDSAFFNCGSLESITIPKSVTSIGAGAFESCGKLGSVTFVAGSELTSIGAHAFLNCCNLGSIEIPASVTSIGDYAFCECYDLKDIWYHGTEAQWSNVPKGTNWDGGNNNLTVHCELSIKVSSDPSAGGTVSASFGQDVPTPAAGKYWSNTDVTLTATANSNYAFVNWTENVNGSVTTVSTDASYSFTATTDRDLVANFAIGGTCGDHLTWTLDGNGTLTISGTGAMYDSVQWNGQKENIKKVVINNGVTTIGDLAFFQCVNLGSVEIPSSVTTIRSKAFENCTNLTSVTFADGSQLERVGDYAFSGSGLGSIEIPASVTSIGASAFLSCGNLESVTFAEGSALTSMGESAFQLCKKLTSVTIPSGVTSIENYAFDTCTGLTDVTIPSSVTSIGNYAFNACSRLRSIEIPAGVKSIGVDAFRDCESLESVTIPSSVTSIGNFAFCSCSKLESVTIPSSVTSMGVSAFQHCKKLTSVTIERSDTATVLAIGSDAFLCGTDSATLSWTGNTPAGQGVVFTVSPDTAGYSISGTTLSWNANPNSTAEATLRATFVQLPSAKLEVTKEFNDWGKADSFTFNLAAVTEGAPMPVYTTAVATKDEPTAVFDTVTYDTAGTYEYTITEVNGGADGVSYDTTPHEVVVTVSKDNNTNALSATVKYDGADSLIVTNTFATTTATLQVTKEFNDWGKADSFTFELAPVDNAPMPANSTTVPVTTTATKDLPIASFGEITYDKAGTYKYTITERNGGADGVTYDKAAHNVVVTVTKAEDATNALSATVAYDGAASLTVKNTFTPATAPTITGPENLTLTYGYTTDNKLSVTATPATDGTYDLGYQWYSCEDTVKTNPQKIDLATEASYAIPTGKSAETTEYYYCEVTATRTDNGQTATASSAVATVTINRVPAPTSLTDAQKPTPTAPTADGTPQALVIPPQELPSGYTGVKYSIDGGTNWTELNVVPTAIVPDTYVVQVLYVPDGNHTAIEGTPVKAVILPNYNVVEAESTSSWLKGSRDDAVIKVRLRGLSGKDDNSFQHFKSVAIDGAVLSEDSSALIQKDYKAEEGSTVITLHKKMLNRLSAGPHTVTITFDNGEVEAPLTILVPPGGYSPATGDSARIGFWAALMVLAGLGFAGANYARRRLRRPRYVGKH